MSGHPPLGSDRPDFRKNQFNLTVIKGATDIFVRDKATGISYYSIFLTEGSLVSLSIRLLHLYMVQGELTSQLAICARFKPLINSFTSAAWACQSMNFVQ